MADLVPAEGHVHGEEAVLLPGLQLLLVDVVLGPVPAPKEEEGGAHRLALLLLPGPLLGGVWSKGGLRQGEEGERKEDEGGEGEE